MKLGIDFGTTRTVIAGTCNGRYPVALFDIGGIQYDYIPGMAAVRDGALLFGWDAAAAIARGADAAIRSIKRLVGELAPDDMVPGLTPEITALDLTTGFLTYVRRALSEHCAFPGDIDAWEATVAVPAQAGSRHRYLTLEAFSRAGFQVCGMHNEPTAAAIEFAHHHRSVLARRSPKRYLVVYDLGGGTFDTAAVSLRERRFAVLANEGIRRLGGDDFDAIIGDMVCARAGLAADALDSATQVLLRETCRQAKERLGPSSRRLVVDLDQVVPGAGRVTLATSAIYDQCEPLIARSLAGVSRVFATLGDHGIDPDNPREFGGLYVVGGAAAFPPIGRALRRQYGRKIEIAPQPQAATAIGLAVAADPQQALVVRESVTRHFGVWREAESGRDKVFDALLSKNMAVAEDTGQLVVHRQYRPTHTVGRLRFFECGALNPNQQPAGEVTPWTQIDFPYDPTLACREDLAHVPVRRHDGLQAQEICETYTYGVDGTIAVEIENCTHGYRRSFVLGTLR